MGWGSGRGEGKIRDGVDRGVWPVVRDGRMVLLRWLGRHSESNRRFIIFAMEI